MTNKHWLILGASGVGKTTFIRRIIGDFAQDPSLRVHVFDVHGDIYTDPSLTSEATFSESSDCGINPLKLSADPDYGGVRRRINSFISMLNRYGGRIGQRQENVLRALLLDLYASKGFYRDRPETWNCNGRKYPTIADLRDFTMIKLKKLVMGDCDEAIQALDALAKKTAKVARAHKEADPLITDGEREDLITTFTRHVKTMKTAQELESYIHYDSKDVLKSTLMRVENLCSSGLYKDSPPLFARSKPIWRYCLQALSDIEQCYLIELYLEKVFSAAKQAGIVGDGEIRNYVVIDEVQKVASEEPDHILNVIARQARKFGLGLILAAQSHKHLAEDVIANCATKVFLGLDPLHQDDAARRFKVNEKRIRAIQARRTGLIQMKTHSDYLNNNYSSFVLERNS